MKTGLLRPLTAARWTSGQRAVNIGDMNTRILLVEDDERLAELTAEYLTKNDLKVSIEPRGDTAEARILAEQPDLVILDVMLPGKDAVSYTHLRAHETVLDLVCRLLLEKNHHTLLYTIHVLILCT